MQIDNRLDHVFGALADPTRRGMLALLARQQRTAGELGEPFHITQPAASKHIRVLETAGLVTRRVDGRVHRFELRRGPLADAERWIARHRQLWDHALSNLEALLEEKP